MKNFIQLLIEEELRTLLERKRSEPKIMYHGTSSKFLPKIFQLGMIPEPSEGKWKDDRLEQKASVISPTLRSLKGSYWTDNVATASGAGADTTRTIGGTELIIVAQIVPQTAKADEDDVRGPVLRAFRKVIIPHYGHRDVGDIAWPMLGAFEANPKLHKEVVDAFATELHNTLKTSDKMPLDKNLMEYVFDAAHQRLLGHVHAIGRMKWAYIESFEHELEHVLGDNWGEAKKIAQEKAEKNDIPVFDKVAGERKFLDALDKVSLRYKKSAMPPSEEQWRLRTNLRVTEPVGFSGRNKIICILLVKDSSNFKVVYGAVPDKFLEDWKNKWGPHFRIVDRNDKEIFNTLKQSAD